MATEPTSFMRLVQQIRSSDPLTYEAAYLEMSARAHELVPELLAQLETAPDPYTRGKFVELLGDSRDPTAVPALAVELQHADQDVRQWAVSALEKIGGDLALELVGKYRKDHPSEFA